MKRIDAIALSDTVDGYEIIVFTTYAHKMTYIVEKAGSVLPDGNIPDNVRNRVAELARSISHDVKCENIIAQLTSEQRDLLRQKVLTSQ